MSSLSSSTLSARGVSDPRTLLGLGGEEGVERLLEMARRHLGMEFSFLTRLTEGEQRYVQTAGDASFQMAAGLTLPLSESYCQQMVDGLIPNAVSDTSTHPLLRDLGVTHTSGIGSYVGVPVTLSDGSTYGSLCTISHSSHPVDAKDARFLSLLSEILATELSAQREREILSERLRRVIEAGEVQTALQPVVEIRGGVMLGAEALSRFAPELGAPDVVFAAAHGAGLGMEMERLAVRRALEALPRLGGSQYLALNLTPSVVLELVEGAERWREVPFHRLVLEITEHAAVENYAVLRDALRGVRARGLRLAIDDAGAGYASLHHIVELAPDIIKVDRSLIDGMSGDPARQSVVRAFVGLAADLGAKVVAEGVEEVADLEAARSLSVDAVQGYLVARPSLLEETSWSSRRFTGNGAATSWQVPAAQLEAVGASSAG